MLAFEQVNTSPVWPPTGVALAAILCFGLRVWPGILAGAWLINLHIGSNMPLALSIATGNTLEAVVAGYLIMKFASPAPFASIRETVFFIMALSFSTMISASIGIGSLYGAGVIDEEHLGALWETWWLGDLVGGLVVAPLLLTWRHLPKTTFSRAKLLEAAFLVLITLGVITTVFGRWSLSSVSTSHDHLAFALLPLLVWTALRFRHHGATLIVVIMSVGAIIGTLQGYGPFLMASENESLLTLQVSVGAAMVTAMILMAIQEEKLAANRELKFIQQDLESVVTRRTEELKQTNYQLELESVRQHHLTDTLHALLDNIDLSSRDEFFVRCAESLSSTYKTRFAMIGVFSDKEKTLIQTLAVWAGDHEGDNFSYALKGTPCEDVLNNSMELVPEHVAERYP